MKIQRILISMTVPVLFALPAAGQGDPEEVREMHEDLRQAGCMNAPIYTPEDVVRFSTDVMCRFRAVQFLGLRGDRRAVPALAEAYKEDSDPGVRDQALVELIRLGERQYAAVAHETLAKRTNLGSKAVLAGQMAEAGDGSGLPHIQEACGSQETEDRRSCASTLGMFRKLAAKDPKLLNTILDQILVLAEDPDVAVRQVAMLGLASYSRAMALPPSFMSQLGVLAGKSTDGEVQRLIKNVTDTQAARNR